MPHIVEIAPDLLQIISNILGKAILPNIFFEKVIRINFCNYGSEQYMLWYAMGSKFEFIHYLDKGQMNLKLPVEKMGNAMLVTNYKRTKYSIIAPLSDFSRPAGDVTPGGQRVEDYQIDVNPEDAAIWLHYRANLLGPNGTPSYRNEKLRPSVEYKWRTDFQAIAPRLTDVVRD